MAIGLVLSPMVLVRASISMVLARQHLDLELLVECALLLILRAGCVSGDALAMRRV